MAFRPGRPTLTAAGRRVNFADRHQLDQLRTGRPRWPAEAWSYYEGIGSVRWSLDLVSRLASRCQVGLGWYPQPHDPAMLPSLVPLVTGENGQPTVDDEGEIVAPDAWPEPATIAMADAILARVIDGIGGPHELLSLGTIHLNVPGETWVIGRRVDHDDGPVEVWSLHSGDTIEVRGDIVTMRLADGAGQGSVIELSTAVSAVDGTPGAYAARIWNRHPRFQDQATSTMRAVLEDCEELQLIRRRLRAVHRSHVSAGILVIAQELDGPAATPSEGDEVESDDAVLEGDVAEDIGGALLTPVNEETSDAGVVPLIITAPHEMVQTAVKHTTFGRTSDPTILTERDSLERRIANGLPLPPEAVTGVGDVNHWTAWQVAEDTFRVGVAPPIETLLRGFSTFVLQELMIAAGIPPVEARKVCVWYDPADAIARPDPIAVIAAAFGAGVINATAYRRYLPGVTDEDAPDTTEVALRILQGRGVLTAETTAQLIAIFGGPSLDVAEPAAIGAPAGEVEDAEVVDEPAEGPPPDGPPNGPGTGLVAAGAARADLVSARLGEIERSLTSRLLEAADAAVARAVERVGARARSMAQRSTATTAAGVRVRDAVTGIPAAEVPRRLGAAVLAALGTGDEDEIRAELAGILATYLRLVDDAATQTIALLSTLAADPGQAAAVLVYAEQLTASVTVSGDFFIELLIRDTMRQLFDDPALDTATLGELDRALRVTPATLRRALAVAGGGNQTDPLSALGGLTGGPIATEAAAAADMVRIGFDWVYGPGLRGAPFHPHLRLDSEFFADYESPVLATGGTGGEWVGPWFYPGDHAGCQCDAQPVFRPRPTPE